MERTESDAVSPPLLGDVPSTHEGFGSLSPGLPVTLEEALDRLDVETARRLHAEESLREVEERFRQLSERAGKFVWLSDVHTNELLYVSPGYEQVWTRTREGNYASAEDWSARFRQRQRQRPEDATYAIAGPDGRERWIRDRMFPVRDSSGHIIQMLGIAEDITDARQAQEALGQLQEKCRALLAAVPDMVLRIRKDSTVVEFRPSTDPALFLRPECVQGKTLEELLPDGMAEEATRHLAQALRTREVYSFNCQYLLAEEVRDFEVRGIASAEGEALVVLHDVTYRKRLEREILEVSSREQQRIGQDLHDGLGQHLTGITFLAKVLERKLEAKMAPEAKDAAEIGRLVMQALAQTRNLARGLFPVELERNGLVAAIAELASSVERMCQVRCCFNAHEGIVVPDNVTATHVFRIAQEAINNSVKHGKAKHIEVTLQPVDDHIVLSVTDNGTGLTPKSKMDGLGMRIMHYRARRIGGTLEVTTAPAGGTRVTCAFRNKHESN